MNKSLERHLYPLPKIQDLLREMKRPKWITTLDLIMGYYSRILSLKSREMTAFVLPWGKYRYARLPMGVASAVDEFQAVMHIIVGDLPFVIIYMERFTYFFGW